VVTESNKVAQPQFVVAHVLFQLRRHAADDAPAEQFQRARQKSGAQPWHVRLVDSQVGVTVLHMDAQVAQVLPPALHPERDAHTHVAEAHAEVAWAAQQSVQQGVVLCVFGTIHVS